MRKLNAVLFVIIMITISVICTGWALGYLGFSDEFRIAGIAVMLIASLEPIIEFLDDVFHNRSTPLDDIIG